MTLPTKQHYIRGVLTLIELNADFQAIPGRTVSVEDTLAVPMQAIERGHANPELIWELNAEHLLGYFAAPKTRADLVRQFVGLDRGYRPKAGFSVGVERKADGVWLTIANGFGQSGSFNLGPGMLVDGKQPTMAMQLLLAYIGEDPRRIPEAQS